MAPNRLLASKHVCLQMVVNRLLMCDFLVNRVSPRTPVTENDPLGALQQPSTPPPTAPTSEMTFQSPVIPTDTPVLFRSSVQRSATFEGSPPTQTKGLHRSETVPASSVTSSLASLSSSLKMNFRFVQFYTH